MRIVVSHLSLFPSKHPYLRFSIIFELLEPILGINKLLSFLDRLVTIVYHLCFCTFVINFGFQLSELALKILLFSWSLVIKGWYKKLVITTNKYLGLTPLIIDGIKHYYISSRLLAFWSNTLPFMRHCRFQLVRRCNLNLTASSIRLKLICRKLCFCLDSLFSQTLR